MKKVKIYNSYRRLFAILLLLTNCIFILLRIIDPETAHSDMLIFGICNLVFIVGLFIKMPLLTIESHGIRIKNGEEMHWNEIAEIAVGNKIRNRNLIEKIPNPFANHGAFANYNLIITPIEQPVNSNVTVQKRISLNFSDLDPDLIEELLFTAIIGTKVVMFKEEEVE